MAGLEVTSPVLYWARKYHVNTRGDNMKFDRMPYLIHLYKDFTNMPHMVVMKSAQCGLSELFIVGHLYEAAVLGLTVFYVLPKYELRNRFVSNRIDKPIRRVAFYHDKLREAGGAARLSMKHFGRGTIAYVASFVEDEFVEIPVDSAYVDEKDLCNQDNLAMIPDRLTASPYKFEREISNPSIEGRGIDKRYQESTKSRWMIKCEHCNYEFSIDFFEHIVRQVDANRWAARDPEYRFRETTARVMCPKCSRPMDRLKNGRWVAEHPGREWFGFQIGKQINKYVDLGKMIDKWMEVCIKPVETQLFYNFDLGLPYSAEGAKFGDGLLNGCQRQYAFPIEKKDTHGPIEIGIDVGSVMHCIVRERVKDEHGEWVRRLVWLGALPSFALVRDLIKQWNPKMVVIDAQPEIHEVMNLKEAFRQVYSSKFTQGQLQINVNKNDRIISMDRTALIDALRSEFEAEQAHLPVAAEHLDRGDYYSHMKASTRVLEVNETNPEKSYYSWEHTTPDHYMLAEAYCLQADLMIPRDSVVDFYSNLMKEKTTETGATTAEVAAQTGLSPEEVARLSALGPDQFLGGIKMGRRPGG